MLTFDPHFDCTLLRSIFLCTIWTCEGNKTKDEQSLNSARHSDSKLSVHAADPTNYQSSTRVTTSETHWSNGWGHTGLDVKLLSSVTVATFTVIQKQNAGKWSVLKKTFSVRFNGSYSASLIKAVSLIITVTSSSLLSWPIVSRHKDSSLPAEVTSALSPAGTREDRASVLLTETPSAQLHDTITSLYHSGIKILRLWGGFFFSVLQLEAGISRTHAGCFRVGLGGKSLWTSNWLTSTESTGLSRLH